MAPEEPVTEDKKAERPQLYKVHSMVRKVATRLKRAKAPSRHRFVQRLAGGTITVRRARAATITRAQLERHLEELKKATEEGRIMVTTPTGREVDLSTLEVTAPLPPSKPKPHPLPDSAANDKTFPDGVGQKMPMFPDGAAPQDNPPPPAPTTIPDGVEDGEKEEPATPVTPSVGSDPAAARKAEREQKEASETKPEGGGDGE